MGLKTFIGYTLLGLPKPKSEEEIKEKYTLMTSSEVKYLKEIVHEKEERIKALQNSVKWYEQQLNVNRNKEEESQRQEKINDEKNLSLEANRTLHLLKEKKRMTAKDIIALTGYDRPKTWRIFRQLERKGYAEILGEKKSKYIALKEKAQEKEQTIGL